jgi:hypothetical protein
MEISAVSSPMDSERCSPRMVCANTSSPIWLVPNQWLAEGGCRKDR